MSLGDDMLSAGIQSLEEVWPEEITLASGAKVTGTFSEQTNALAMLDAGRLPRRRASVMIRKAELDRVRSSAPVAQERMTVKSVTWRVESFEAEGTSIYTYQVVQDV